MFFLQSFLQLKRKYGIVQVSMKKLLFSLIGFLSLCPYLWAFTGGIGESTYTLDVTNMFPSYRKDLPSDRGIDNIADYVVGMIPTMTTLIALGATIMVIL